MTTKMEEQPAGTLKRFIREELLNGQADVEVDDDLLAEGKVDSIGMMWLVGFIEENWQVQVPAEDITIEHFHTIRAIETYLKQRQAVNE